MADNYVISVGVKADFSDLKSEAKQGSAAIDDFAARNKAAGAALKEAQAAWDEAYAALGKAAEEGSAQATAALQEYADALRAAKAQVAQLAAEKEADAAATEALAAANRELAVNTRAAYMDMRVLSGSTYGAAMGASQLLGKMPGLGSALASGFALGAFGAAGLVMILVQAIGAVGKFASDAQALSLELGTGWLQGAVGQVDGLAAALKQADAEILSIDKDLDSLKQKDDALDVEHIRLTQGPKAAFEAQISGLNRYIEAQKSMLAFQQQARDEYARAAAPETVTDPKSGMVSQVTTQANLKARVQVAGIDKQIQDTEARIRNAQDQIRNFNDEIANIKPPKAARSGGSAPNYSDALAAQELEQGKSLGATVLYWEKIVATTGKYHEQLLNAEEAFQREIAGKRNPLFAGAGAEPGSADLGAAMGQGMLAANAAAVARTGTAWDGYKDAVAQASVVQAENRQKTVEARVALEQTNGTISASAAAQELAAARLETYRARIEALRQELERLKAEGTYEPLTGQNTNAENATKQQDLQNQIGGLQGDMAAAQQQGLVQGARTNSKQWQQTWGGAFQGATQQFSSTVASWMTLGYGYEGQWSIMTGRMAAQLADRTTAMLINMGMKWAEHEALVTAVHLAGLATRQAADLMANGQLIGLLLAKLGIHLGHETAVTAAHVTANAAKTASDAAAAATSTAVIAATNVAQVASFTAVAAMGAAASQASIPVVGPELAAAAAAAMTGLGAGYTALAAFEKGGIISGPMGSVVPIAGHAGERVLSVQQTRNFETMVNAAANGAAGTPTVHYHDHTNLSGIDGASVASMYRRNGAAGRREFMRQLRRMNKI